jgi:hypothetical protein
MRSTSTSSKGTIGRSRSQSTARPGIVALIRRAYSSKQMAAHAGACGDGTDMTLEIHEFLGEDSVVCGVNMWLDLLESAIGDLGRRRADLYAAAEVARPAKTGWRGSAPDSALSRRLRSRQG